MGVDDIYCESSSVWVVKIKMKVQFMWQCEMGVEIVCIGYYDIKLGRKVAN